MNLPERSVENPKEVLGLRPGFHVHRDAIDATIAEGQIPPSLPDSGMSTLHRRTVEISGAGAHPAVSTGRSRVLSLVWMGRSHSNTLPIVPVHDQTGMTLSLWNGCQALLTRYVLVAADIDPVRPKRAWLH